MMPLDRSSAGAAFVRFAINGGGVALVAISTYFLCAVAIGMPPLYANALAYTVQLVLGYHVHRVYSFGQPRTNLSSIVRYMALSISAFMLNSFWVWMATGLCHLPAWTPIMPMVAITPLMTFLVGRQWVFGASRQAL
jgi:putative flippase GtrA